ncbi:MAG: hypothetical protein OEM59_01915 [Rhodospirillales bacterium]|nr:hypothetical protein [Rhodospirillales bacterium]
MSNRDPQTMAAIHDLKIELLGEDRRARTATIRISYQAEFSMLERDMPGLHFREDIQLCGTYSLDPEDFLYQLAQATFAVAGERAVQRERIVTVDSDILEVGGRPQPVDQLYAKLWVTPLLPRPDFKECSLSISNP